jgi:hypothetical protein
VRNYKDRILTVVPLIAITFSISCCCLKLHTSADAYAMRGIPKFWNWEKRALLPVSKIPLEAFQYWALPPISNGFIVLIDGKGLVWLSGNVGEGDSCYAVSVKESPKQTDITLTWWKRNSNLKWYKDTVRIYTCYKAHERDCISY